MADVQTLPVLALTAVVGACILIVIWICSYIRKGNSRTSQDDTVPDERVAGNGVSSEPLVARKKEKTTTRKQVSRPNFTHQWLACSLKAHSGEILGLDYSPNGKYLASCSEDRTVHLWHVKDFCQKDHKSVRANVEFDHATRVRFSPDSRAFITNLCNGEVIRVFKITKKDDGTSVTIQAAFDFSHKYSADVINIGIASNGRFIMTCYADTAIKIWDIKGELLSTIDTRQMNNSHGSVSPCGRFVASSGFTPDVKVWEVCFDKSGTFQEVKRAFELKGHSAGVYHFSFSSDSRRMATVSKDGTWRLWDTNDSWDEVRALKPNRVVPLVNVGPHCPVYFYSACEIIQQLVEYKKSQDPYLLRSWKYPYSGPSLIAISPDARSVAVSTGSSINFYSTVSDECDEAMEDVFAGPITALEFSIDSRYLAATGGKHVNVFYNVTGYRATVAELEEKKKTANTAAMKERIEEQIVEARQLLKSVEMKSS